MAAETAAAPQQSAFGKLNSKDLIKGLIMAIVGAAGGGIVAAAQAGTLMAPAVWIAVGKSAALTGAAYLFKNWLTDGDGKFIKLIE